MSPLPYWNKILIPTDFSEDSLRAVAEAARLQTLTQADVVLAHITEPRFEGLRIHTGDLHHQMEIAAKQQLESLAAASFPAANVSVVVKEGRAADAICNLAQSLKVDAIVIGSHGVTAMKHLMLGSVTEKVVRHAPCHVLVVR